MSVINLLSTSLGVRNEIPNQKLAWEIAEIANREAVEELIEHLQLNKDKGIKSDCIKVLYEVGYKKPELIADFLPVFVKLLENKDNRLIWGSMIAISNIAGIVPSKVYADLPKIIQAIDKGSVITIDAGVEVLSKLASFKEYQKDCFPLLLEQLKFCPPKQLAQYAEKATKAVNINNKKVFIELINSRIPQLENDSQKKRISALLRRME